MEIAPSQLQVRFDGTLGFPGGLIDGGEGELPEEAVSREFAEESGCVCAEVAFSAGDHVITHYSPETRFCLHFFAKEVSLEKFAAVERSTVAGGEWGEEVGSGGRRWGMGGGGGEWGEEVGSGERRRVAH